MAAAALTAPCAQAENVAATGNVALKRAAPFDRWCVAPVCQPAGGEHPHASLFEPPAVLQPQTSDGFLEQALKAQLIASIDQQARALDVWSKPVADLSESAVAALSKDQHKLELGLGLTGAVMRAALVLEAAKGIPERAGCAGSERLDAVYEGLAVSVALAPLKFPQASGGVPASCVETAGDAQRLVDRTALRALVPPEVVQAVKQAMAKVRAAEKACRPLLEQVPAEAGAEQQTTKTALALPEHASIAEYEAYWAKLQQLRTPELPQNSVECSAALGGPESVSLPGLPQLHDLGLENAEAEALAAVLEASSALQHARAELEEQLAELLKAGALSRHALETLVARVVRDLKPAALSDDVWSHLVNALAEAVVLDATGRAALDPTLVVQALKDAYGLDEHGVPTLRTLLGFKPTPWVGDANVGVPSLTSSDFRVVGDARLGYQGKLFGIVAHGGIKEFDLDQGGVITEDSHYFGGADAALLFGGERDKLRVEARLSALVDYVDTTVLSNSVTAGGANFQDYDSTLLRGGAALGLRIAPNERFVARVSAGAGVQFETHDTTTYFQNNSFESVSTVSGRYTGGLLAAYRFWPGVLGVRARGSVDYYRLTVDRLAYDFMNQPTLEQPESSQLEASGHLFLDLDIISFVGFVPAAFAGIDYLSRAGAGPDVTATTPSFGVGLMRRSD